MSGGSWKVAYADFMTAMMAFFLLMWILGMVPEEKRSEIAGYFQDPGGYQSRSTIIDHNAPPPIGSPSDLESELTPAQAEHLAINRFLQNTLKDQITNNQARVQPSEAGVLLRTSDALTFEPGETDLGQQGQVTLNAVIEVMRRFKVHLFISGHTDGAETGAPRFKDKWELSAARAAAVTAYIVERGGISPAQIMSASYANYRPIVPDTAEAPNPVNRRVEFFFYSPDTRPANLGFN